MTAAPVPVSIAFTLDGMAPIIVEASIALEDGVALRDAVDTFRTQSLPTIVAHAEDKVVGRFYGIASRRLGAPS